MPFKTALKTEIIRGRVVDGRQWWRLIAPLEYESSETGKTYIVPAGYETDFASVPRLPFAYWLTGDTAHEAAVVHDFVLDDPMQSEDTADHLFLEAMAECDVPWWRRKAMFLSVRLKSMVRRKPQLVETQK